MNDHVPDLRHPLRAAAPGLAAVPHLLMLPRSDRFAGRLPDVLLTRLADTPPGVTVLGVDEDTALVVGATTWEVVGRQSVWVLTAADGLTEHPTGSVLETPTG